MEDFLKECNDWLNPIKYYQLNKFIRGDIVGYDFYKPGEIHYPIIECVYDTGTNNKIVRLYAVVELS